MNFNVPILFQIFNRLDTSLKVFDEIKKVKPANLYIVQDAPRKSLDEEGRCLVVRNTILSQIDWECNLITLFRDENMGPGAGTADAIIWFFKQVEYGIVLEHDCLPHTDFFYYCSTLLEKYKYEDKIMLITGSNYQNGRVFGQGSYYLGASAQIWGWAGWRRTFDNYEYNIDKYDKEIVFKDITATFKGRDEQDYYKEIYDLIKNRKIDTWDYQLMFTIWHQNALIVIPNRNLISNIGFGPQAINCTIVDSLLANSKIFSILPLKHISKIKRNYKSDRNYFRNYLICYPTIVRLLLGFIIKYTPSFIHKSYKYFKKNIINFIL